jgi:hypothetical protein
MEALHIWRKRWVLTSCMLLLALVGTGVAALKAPRTYQSNATVVLLASHNSSKATGGGNPYLSFTDSLSTTASVISSEVMDPQTAATLKSDDCPEGYQVVSQSTLSNSTSLPAPFLLITVTGNNKYLVERTLHGVAGEIGTVLNNLQSGVSRNNRILLVTASIAPAATLSVTSTARPLAVVLGLLIILALGIPLAVDAWSTRRNMRRTAGHASASAEPSGRRPASDPWEGRTDEGTGHGVRQPSSTGPSHGRTPYASSEDGRLSPERTSY